MPFTFSHPAIVLPITFLNRKWFSLTALAIGSMVPDFEYFLRMKTLGVYGHTISGVFWFDLPLAIILAFLFHNVVRDNLFDNLPTNLKSRFSTFKEFNWNVYFKKNWLIVVISILIGTLSHLFWDNFTHSDGYFVQKIPQLANLLNIMEVEIPYYKILQHLSTVVGGLIITYSIFKLPIDKNVLGNFNIKYWGILTTLTLTIIAIRLLTGLDYKLYGDLIVTSVSAVLISLTLTPILFKGGNVSD